MEEQSVRCVIVEKVISRPDFRELRVCQAGQGLLNIPIANPAISGIGPPGSSLRP
jgi:hypothetical protein